MHAATRCLAASILLAAGAVAAGPLVPVDVADGRASTVELDGAVYRQASPGHHLYYDAPVAPPADGGPLYARVVWRESGIGTIHLQYDSADPAIEEGLARRYREANRRHGFLSHGRSVDRVALFALDHPRLAGGQNGGADLRLRGALEGGTLTIREITLTPDPPAEWLRLNDEPWRRPYDGPTRADVPADTLDRRILCGYQGWFTTPDDGSDMGWFHWSRDTFRLDASTLTVDMWPDTTGYPAVALHTAAAMRLADGSPARLYSSHQRETVLHHFRLMRQYGIDGVFLSRFVSMTQDPIQRRHINTVLAHVREGAHREGRVWAMMIDISAGPDPRPTSWITDDWRYLVDEVGIREDSRYLRHGGRPVVFLWGFGFADRGWTPQQAIEVIDFFRHDPRYGGVYLIGGVPSYWRTLGIDGRTDPEWAAVYRRFDAISPWAAGRFRTLEDLAAYRENVWRGDLAELQSLGMGYMPTAFPGFSWDNLMRHTPGTSLIPRLGGRLLWQQLHDQQAVGVSTTFVGMFDEVDEATAIFPVTDDVPVPGHFVGFERHAPDYYLRMVGTATRMRRGEIPLTASIPDPLLAPSGE